MRLLLLPVALVTATLACASPTRAPDKASADALQGGADATFSIPGFAKRDYLLHLPPGYDGRTAIPVVVALHGGGGHKDRARSVTCPNGDLGDPGCLTAVADREGFAVVFPNGAPGVLFDDIRTWNAGGGASGFQCVSGAACKDNIDDMAYLDALHDELLRAVAVDADRVYATGLSNGAAMAHRLACERSTRFAAIAAVAGGNQVATVQGCTIARPVPVLVIHGTADPCWGFEQSAAACAQDDDQVKVGVFETVVGWVERNGCAAEAAVEPLPDTADDGMTTRRERHSCASGGDVVLLRTEGGGHTWPGGEAYLDESVVGPVTRDYDADDEIWSFFAAHPRPIFE